jgi:hypothetical protein
MVSAAVIDLASFPSGALVLRLQISLNRSAPAFPRSDCERRRDLTPEQRKLLATVREEHPSASVPVILQRLVAEGRLDKGRHVREQCVTLLQERGFLRSDVCVRIFSCRLRARNRMIARSSSLSDAAPAFAHARET